MAKTQGPVQNLGPVGERVARNIRRLRGAMTYKLLSERLEKLGRPISVLGLSRIESQARRVDADDLMALAQALEVTPNALLMPPVEEQGEIGLTPALSDDWENAWRWAEGEQPGVRWTGAEITGVGFLRDSTPRLSASWLHRWWELVRPRESEEVRGARLLAEVQRASSTESGLDGQR